MTTPARTLLVADSFRVRVAGGVAEARGFERHLERFTSAVLAACDEGTDGPECIIDDNSDVFDPLGLPTFGIPKTRASLPDFLREARDRIADYGQGFPRLELWRLPSHEFALDLALRPLPELTDAIRLRSAGSVRLRHPERKGPNIATLGALNRELGAEGLLQDETGHAVEGATTSLVYWPAASPTGPGPGPSTGSSADPGPGGTSGHVIASAARVPSITEALLRAAAGRSGARYSLTPRRPRLPELQGAEVWAVNALHGIRLVTHIDDVALPSREPERIAWFRTALDRSWTPVLGGSDRTPAGDPAHVPA